MQGLVTKSTGSWYSVLNEATGERLDCRLRGQFRIHGIKNTNPVIVGDRVEYDIEKDGTGVITRIEPRKNYIERKSTNLSKISHLIAANIDLAFLVITLKEPRTSLGFIDRFLVAAEGFRIPVCLVFNKMDLYNEAELDVVAELSELYTNIGYQVLHTSVVTGLGIDELREKIAGCWQRSALEDLYQPYKPKRRTRAQIAKEKGFGPLADSIWDGHLDDAALKAASEEDLQYARDIIAERVADMANVRGFVRRLFADKGVLKSEVASPKPTEAAVAA